MMAVSGARQLFRFLVRRLREPNGPARLRAEIALLLREDGFSGFLKTVRGISGSRQRTLAEERRYALWIERHETPAGAREVQACKTALREKDLCLIVRLETGDPARLDRVCAGLHRQFLKPGRLHVLSADTVPAPHALLKNRTGAVPEPAVQLYDNEPGYLERVNVIARETDARWLVFTSSRQCLAPSALHDIAREAERAPDAPFVFADEDHMDADGTRTAPVFKPGWDPELFDCTDYTGDLICCSREAFVSVGGFDTTLGHGAAYDLKLRLAEAGGPVAPVRLPEVLSHRLCASAPGSGLAIRSEAEAADDRRARRAGLERRGMDADVVPGALGACRLRFRPGAQRPRVSVIIPTRDRLDLLRQTVDGLLQATRYRPMDILIVDNESRERATLDYLAALQERGEAAVLKVPGEFNYSRLNNMAARVASGEVLCLLNNDIKVIHDDWLEEMVSRAVQPGIGAVGARLLYGDGRVQHAGVVLGVRGTAAHAFRFASPEAPGPLGRLQLPHSVSAVTAACLCVLKARYEAVGGLDETHLKITYNDVDLCLKLQDAGYRNVVTPHATLYHLESASRGGPQTPEQIAQARAEVTFLRSKWAELIREDPHYSPNLTRLSEDYSIGE